MLRPTTLLFAAILALATTAQSQSFPLHHEAALAPQDFIDSFRFLRDVGDLDGDGRADYAVRVQSDPLNAFTSSSIQLISGVDGQFIRSLESTLNPFMPRTQSLSSPGDIDGDGRSETAHVFQMWNGTATRAELRGGDGSLLWLVGLTSNYSGINLESASEFVRQSDLDGDGTDDLAIAIYGAKGATPTSPPLSPSRIQWRSGADGSLLHEIIDASLIIDSISNAGDTNGDGVDDLLIAASTSPFIAPDAGGVSLVSGADFSYLHFWNGTAAGDRFGTGVAAAGDVNGDGFDDVMISGQASDAVEIFSGLDASLLQSLPLGIAGAYLAGIRDRPEFDWNGDGVRDWLIETQGGPTRYQIRSGSGFATLRETNGELLDDVNGDGLPEIIEDQTAPLPKLTVIAHKGAQSYGAGSGGLTLSWEPSLASPETGTFVVSGGTPAATVLIAGSGAPTNETIFGTTFPLLVSPSPANLFLQLTTNLNGLGTLRAAVTLTEPLIAGATLYYQCAELAPNPGTSNGLQLLFNL
jgi:hypothetical protein